MRLTREFKQTVQARIRADRNYRKKVLCEGIECLLTLFQPEKCLLTITKAPEIWMSVRAFVGLEHFYLQRLECSRIELKRALHIAHGQNNMIKHMGSLFHYPYNTQVHWWKHRAQRIKPVIIETGNGKIRGKRVAVNPDGSIIIQTEQGNLAVPDG